MVRLGGGAAVSLRAQPQWLGSGTLLIERLMAGQAA